MGYRNTIKLAVRKGTDAHKAIVAAQDKYDLLDDLGTHSIDGAVLAVYGTDWHKWDETDAEVEAYMDAVLNVDYADDIEYVRLGEEDGDVEHENSHNCWLSLTIRIG